MNQIFQNQEFGAIRTMSSEQGEVMFAPRMYTKHWVMQKLAMQ